MKLNRILLCALASAALLSPSCKKIDFVLSDNPFELAVRNICSQEAWLDIIPENNDFYYYAYAVKESEYSGYRDDASFINYVHGVLQDSFDNLFPGEPVSRFMDIYLFRESYYFAAYDLEPDTDYYLFAYPYDRDGEPVMNLSKVKFHTAPQIKSDIKFTVSLQGSVVSVKPTNSDQYFWEYEAVRTVENDYLGSPSLYYRSILNMYTEHGFLPSLMSKGDDSEDMSLYYELKTGDEFYIILSGYDRGITSEPEIYLMKYNGEGQAGTVTPYS